MGGGTRQPSSDRSLHETTRPPEGKTLETGPLRQAEEKERWEHTEGVNYGHTSGAGGGGEGLGEGGGGARHV